MANANNTSLPNETWKPVVGYEGLYEVSDHGRVRSLDRVVPSGPGVQRRHKGRVLKGGVKPAGYPYVNLSVGGKIVTKYVHDLVLTAFVGPRPSPELVARHLDDNKAHNHVQNLTWGTESDNAFDKIRNGKDHYSPRSHCVNGHEFTPENTRRNPNYPGTRYCRACALEKSRKNYNKNLERKRIWRAKRRAEGKPVT